MTINKCCVTLFRYDKWKHNFQITSLKYLGVMRLPFKTR